MENVKIDNPQSMKQDVKDVEELVMIDLLTLTGYVQCASSSFGSVKFRGIADTTKFVRSEVKKRPFNWIFSDKMYD